VTTTTDLYGKRLLNSPTSRATKIT